MKRFALSFVLVLFMLPSFSQNNGITVITPNGGENWIIGCPTTIHWVATAASVGTVRIDLYKDGAFYMNICNPVPAGINTYTWIPPYSVNPGNTFKIKVSSLTNITTFDYSDADFSISLGAITVVSPNGGEVWQYGTTHLVIWNGNICENVRIELWKGGAFYSVVASSTPSTGTYPWAITNSIIPGNDYRIKIFGLGLSTSPQGIVYDFSDNDFTIGTGCFVKVTTPNGGELWAAGSTHAITWQSNTTLTLRIELWKGGVYHSLINGSVTNTGSWNWAIPATLTSGTNYKVRIISLNSAAANTCVDFSDNYFTIAGSVVPSAWSVTDQQIYLYPNPASNQAVLVFKAAENSPQGTLTISQLTGRVVLQTETDLFAGKINLDCSGFLPGIYLVEIKGKDTCLKGKLIIH